MHRLHFLKPLDLFTSETPFGRARQCRAYRIILFLIQNIVVLPRPKRLYVTS
jgi:hypothetical protein